MKFVEIDEKQFAKFRKNLVGGGFYQRAERKAVREKMGWKVYFLAAVEDENYSAEDVVFSIAKIDGKIKENFVVTD